MQSVETILGEPFTSRFDVAEVGASTLLLDLEDGDYFALSATAAIVARALAGGAAIDAAIDAVAAARTSARDEAERIVASFVAQLGDRDATLPTPGAVAFSPTDAGLVMAVHGAHVATIARDGAWIEPASSGAPIRERLQWAAPHLLTLLGRDVLHASAVETTRGIVAFSGASGAGKTTTAQLAARAGGRLVSEDLLVVLPSEGVAIVDGERGVRAWIDEAAARFEDGARRIDATTLPACVSGPRAPVTELVLLDASRRADGRDVDTAVLGAVDAVGALLSNAFAEAHTRAAWRHVFRSAVALAQRVPVGCAIVPRGLDALAAGLARWLGDGSLDRA
ncbi:PqqD family peptide modification chaperone [Myxococcota bacterium]|nr:PqqD family peptide modification chaperone [Myxococcota bacterium]